LVKTLLRIKKDNFDYDAHKVIACIPVPKKVVDLIARKIEVLPIDFIKELNSILEVY
jgi:hypothetical protein